MSAAVKAAFFIVPLLASQAAFADRKSEDAQLDTAAELHFGEKPPVDPEKAAIKSAAGRATRKGLTLTLQLSGGKPLVLTNDRSGCPSGNFNDPNCFDFTLVADLPSRHLYVVAYQHYFRGSFLLIDSRTGKRVTIYGAPRISPDGQYVLEINNDLPEGDRMQIWRRIGDGAHAEWTMPNDSQEIDSTEQVIFQGWDGDQIRLDLTSPGVVDRHRPAKLTHEGKDWVFEAAGPPDR